MVVGENTDEPLAVASPTAGEDMAGADDEAILRRDPEGAAAGSSLPHGKGIAGQADTPAGEERDPEGTVPLDTVLEKGTKKRRWVAADE